MAYLALYRKFRPKVFSEVIGQDHIVRIIKNQLAGKNVSHAYLFCGTRGTGKTSTAKLFAKTLNCQNPTEDGPCNVCENCLAVEESRSLNVVEIDAASNNGVDNIREIKEEVRYAPTDGGVKVYIIDEVHMLSTGAFNALLKTLEEPPEHVIFILATTDPQRIPATILSRCQRLDFKRITIDEMAALLKSQMEAEGVKITDDALRYVSGLSDGAMRDAQSLLDQCIAYYADEEIDVDKVMMITGAVDKTIFFDFMDAFNAYDSGKCLQIVEQAVDSGKDISRFISDFIHHMRNLLIITSSTGMNIVDMSPAMYEKCKEQGAKCDMRMLIDYINAFSALSGQLRYAFNERIMLETLCIKLCNPETLGDDARALSARVEKLEKEPKTVVREVVASSAEDKKKPETVVRPKSTPEDIKKVVDGWAKFKANLEEPLASYFRNTIAGYLEGNMLNIVFNEPALVPIGKAREEEIKAKLAEEFHKEFPLSFVSANDYNDNHVESFGEKDPNSENLVQNISKKLGGIDIEVEG